MISEGFTSWWLPKALETEPSPGGTLKRGRLSFVDVDSGSLHQVDVFGEVEKGWVPPHDIWERFELLGKPRFTSDGEVLLSPGFGAPSRVPL